MVNLNGRQKDSFNEGKNYNPMKHCKQHNQIKNYLKQLNKKNNYFKFIAKYAYTLSPIYVFYLCLDLNRQKLKSL